MSTERHTDPADEATAVEQLTTRLALASHANRYQEPAEYNDSGARICIDCEIVIPQARVDSVNAVRCVACQEVEEWQASQFAKRGKR